MTAFRTVKKRVVSGMRTTGKLHLGNYVGALANWVKMQDQYDCSFFLADWHALTTDYADTSKVKENSLEVTLDWLAAGLDPEKCLIFAQSHVPQHAELHLLFSMVTPLGWLERVPTYKGQIAELGAHAPVSAIRGTRNRSPSRSGALRSASSTGSDGSGMSSR